MKYEITVIDDSPDSPLTHGSTSREPITIQRRTVVDFRVVKHSLTTSGEPSMTPPIPEDHIESIKRWLHRRNMLGSRELDVADVAAWINEYESECIAKLTAENNQLNVDFRQADLDRKTWLEAHRIVAKRNILLEAENTRLKAESAQHKLETAVTLEVLTRIANADQIHEATSAILAARAAIKEGQ